MIEDSNSIIDFKCIKSSKFSYDNKNGKNNNDVYCLFDKYSKSFIEIYANSIKIYNKLGTNLKKNIILSLENNKIKNITIDKKFNFLLIYFETPSNEFLVNLIEISSNPNLNVESLSGDFNFLFDFFFINKFDNKQNNKSTNLQDFCLVFLNKIVLYSIISNNCKTKEIFTYKLPSYLAYKDFMYNTEFRILCCLKIDNTFDFFNLSFDKYYKNVFNKSISFIKPIKIKAGFFDSNKNINQFELSRIKNNYFSRDKYTQNQFLLENIYNKLYLIYLSYSENLLHIAQVINLNEIQKMIEFIYKNHNKLTFLQTIDNLILLHNIVLSSIAIIDIKSKTMLLNISTNKNFPYHGNIFSNGCVLELKGINNDNNIFYNVIFNLSKYEKYSLNCLKKYDKNDKHHIKKNFIYLNILHRKKSKEFIINTLHNLILNKKNSKLIIFIFNEIVNIIEENNKTLNYVENIETYSFELIKPINYYIKNKKYMINQKDVYISLFKLFEKDNLNDDIIINIIFFSFNFHLILKSKSIDIESIFNNIIFEYIKKIKNLYKIEILLQNITFPDNFEMAKYFLTLTNNKYNKYLIIEQTGIQMFLNLKNYKEIFIYLLDKEDYPRLFTYLDKNIINIDQSILTNILTSNKKIFNNKELILKLVK